jgi:hypothetical protein
MPYIVQKVDHPDLQAYLDALEKDGQKLIQVIDGHIEYTVISEAFFTVSTKPLIKPKKKYDY